jgi:hypothetical protein
MTYLSREPLASLSSQDATGSAMSPEAPSTLLETGVGARIAACGHAVTDLNPLSLRPGPLPPTTRTPNARISSGPPRQGLSTD